MSNTNRPKADVLRIYNEVRLERVKKTIHWDTTVEDPDRTQDYQVEVALDSVFLHIYKGLV